jgi:hypothetical protein
VSPPPAFLAGLWFLDLVLSPVSLAMSCIRIQEDKKSRSRKDSRRKKQMQREKRKIYTNLAKKSR